MMKLDDEAMAADILLRVDFARQDISGILDKYSDVLDSNNPEDDVYFMLTDIYERLTEFERELVIDNPSIEDYAEEDIR